MATTHKSPQGKAWSPARESDAGNVQGAIGYLPADHGLTFTAGDTIQMVKVPNGATVMDCLMETGAFGSNVLASVGDGDSVALYITAQSVASATLLRKNGVANAGVPKTYSAEDTIDVVLSNADPSDTVALRLDVFYICGVDTTP